MTEPTMPADSRDIVEDAARDIWRFFRSEPEWFDANKSLGGPQWLINRLRDLASPARGEGGAPVAWRWELNTFNSWKPQMTYDRPDDGPRVRNVQPLFTRPTPATPEGLREKVMQAVLLGGDAWAITDAILAALQPQAQPAAPESER